MVMDEYSWLVPSVYSSKVHHVRALYRLIMAKTNSAGSV